MLRPQHGQGVNSQSPQEGGVRQAAGLRLGFALLPLAPGRPGHRRLPSSGLAYPETAFPLLEPGRGTAMLQRPCHPPDRRAFTLIELLVVIAIIGALISLLLP